MFPPGRSRQLFPWRILCFLRFLLFQEETDNRHALFAKADRLAGEVIGAAIEPHWIMGPGLLELSYMKLLNVPLGLLFNFHEFKLVEGISRLVRPSANNS
jgi:hypothetical protein